MGTRSLIASNLPRFYPVSMLGREPRSAEELLLIYAGILAHGTALSAAETARMISQLSRPWQNGGLVEIKEPFCE